MFQNVISHMHKTWDAWTDSLRMPLGDVESVTSEMKRQREAAVGRIEELTDQWASSAKQGLALGASVVDSYQTMWTDWLERSWGHHGKPS